MKNFKVVVLATCGAFSSCATFVPPSLTPDYDSAPLVDNPVVSGTIPSSVNAKLNYDQPMMGGQEAGKQRSTVFLKSRDKSSGKVCILMNTPNPDAPKEMVLRSYDSSQELEESSKQPAKAGEVPLKVVTLSTKKQVEEYNTTEVVQYTDGSGREIGQARKPVTKTWEYTLYELEVCYPGKVLTKKSKYLGLEHDVKGLFSDSRVVTIAWKFN